MKRFSKKWMVLGVVAVVAGLATFGAYAYWTASGTGSGTATVGTDSGVSIEVDSISPALYPGGSATVTFHLHNPSTTTAVTVANVAQNGPVSNLPVGCLAADFSFATVAVNESVAANSDGGSHTGTLSMANTAANQNACKSSSPQLNLTTAP